MDNIIVILIIFAVANYFITGVRKKQAEEQKRAQSAQETQGRAAPLAHQAADTHAGQAYARSCVR